MDSIIAEYKDLLLVLVSNSQLAFDGSLRGALPEEGGVYRVFEKGCMWQNSLYVGTTKTRSLRERVYQQLMGDRIASTLKKKLIDSGQCVDEDAAKTYLQSKCLVQCAVIADKKLRILFEHFAISVLKPQYND